MLVLQTMAAPPSHALALLDAFPSAAVVVWALQPDAGLPAVVDHTAITAQGATVGAPMLTNVLSRRGRPFDLVLGRERELPAERVRAALVAGRLRRARLGRVGNPLEGYLHVDVDDEALRAATGITAVRLAPAEVLERYRAVPGRRLRELRDELGGWDVAVDGDALERSLRVAAAIEELVADHGLDAGAINCHVPELRFSDEIGVTPCYGLGRSTSAGVPWTCTGDAVTAVAMLTTKLLGGSAVYCEIETVDHATGEVVLANSGEHDLSWLRRGERPGLRPNAWFCGVDPRCGACAVFPGQPGPATLVGFTPPRARLSLRRRPRRADRPQVRRDRHGQRRLPLLLRTGLGCLGPLGPSRRQPPQLRDPRRPQRPGRRRRPPPRHRRAPGVNGQSRQEHRDGRPSPHAVAPRAMTPGCSSNALHGVGMEAEGDLVPESLATTIADDTASGGLGSGVHSGAPNPPGNPH